MVPEIVQYLLATDSPRCCLATQLDSEPLRGQAFCNATWLNLFPELKETSAYGASSQAERVYPVAFHKLFEVIGPDLFEQCCWKRRSAPIIRTNLECTIHLGHEPALLSMLESETTTANSTAAESTLSRKELERYASELEYINGELDSFAYAATHDLKSPLRAVNYLTSWILDEDQSQLPERTVQHLLEIQKRVKRMEHLLMDLLAYSRVGRTEHEVQSVDCLSMIEEIIEDLVGIENFDFHVDPKLPTIESYAPPLHQVFLNLISNAVKFHPANPALADQQAPTQQGNIYVGFENIDSTTVRFYVKDDGAGIEPEHHSKIFRLFQSLHTRDAVEGSGIGLAIVRKSVELMGGTISLESQPGQGSTFYFSWPSQLDTATSSPKCAGNIPISLIPTGQTV